MLRGIIEGERGDNRGREVIRGIIEGERSA